MPTRTVCVVDGFNVYHSLRDAARELTRTPSGMASDVPTALAPQRSTRWLDLWALCASYLHVIGRGATLEAVYYFSALAQHLETIKPGLVGRHETYLSALRATGVTVELAHFKATQARCPTCGSRFTSHEEKETDVAIGVRVVELTLSGAYEAIVIVSADSDLLPAVRTARRLRPEVGVWVAFPYRRGSKDLRAAAQRTFKITKHQYTTHQLADSVALPNGGTVHKPDTW